MGGTVLGVLGKHRTETVLEVISAGTHVKHTVVIYVGIVH